LTNKISKHFTIVEVEKSQTSIRLGISNKLPKKFLVYAQDIAINILEKCRNKFGSFTPNSWYRSKQINTRIGGSSTSQHCFGQAVDFEIPGVSNIELGKWINQNLVFDQLIFEFVSKKNPKAGWIHCSYKKGYNRNQVLKAYKYRGKTVYKSIKSWKEV